ncbi:unnamed protein product [Leptosia nina]|uniref:Uncharacterized protein n=1 Tax=Leptosia nina TaxID=320188 RepID=A0AAV1J3X6_9NEOP
MGNIFSGPSVNRVSSPHASSESENQTMERKSEPVKVENDCENPELPLDIVNDEEDARAKVKQEEMTAFHEQLSIKREQRREIMAKHKSDKIQLQNDLEKERKEKLELYEQNQQLRCILQQNGIVIPENFQSDENFSLYKSALEQLTKEVENQKANNNKLRCDLASANNALQAAYSDMADLSAQNSESIKQINALKEVVTVSKTLISLREDQLTALKNKLTEIEQSLADREANMLSTDLRQEYERQLLNIRTLRNLYEDRARLAEVTRQALVRELDEHKVLHQAAQSRCTELNSEVDELTAKVSSLEQRIEDKNNEVSTCKKELEGTRSEMLVINKLFSQVLLGYMTKRDLDKLVKRLEENHDILTHMAEKENGSEVSSALPKLLLELVNQVDDLNNKETIDTNEQGIANIEADQEPIKAEEIVKNLPKVWKVLIELLSHQTEANINESDRVSSCYKSVETKSGSVLVPSVSQTYIRLKDLIMEKLSLIKEVNRMKQLNSHLETTLQEQERRLCLVTTELSKTWHVVGRLRRHHHQLHTHEKILKYELQQKRKLLNELKEELKYCKEKWEQAREKNTQSEKDWKKLRAEFSNRKLQDLKAINNSAESGYSDEKLTDESSASNDESEFIAESKLKGKKKLKKSFETVVDSSADGNLAAEREDPVSDMIDVADLSMDTQDDNQETCDDSYNSECFLKSERNCNETEDEAVEIGNDSCHDDISITESQCDLSKITDRDQGIVNTLFQEEPNYQAGQPETTCTIYSGNNVKNDTIPDITTSCDTEMYHIRDSTNDSQSNVNLDNILNENPEGVTNNANTLSTTNDQKTENNVIREKISEPGPSTIQTTETNLPEIDFKQILENVRKQDEHLKKKDERLAQLENNCAEVVASIKKNIDCGADLVKRLDGVHNVQSVHTSSDSIDDVEDKELISQDEPSTSNELDHEARFAARELRLKRLEEQTKSLVNKVNHTTTKGVKIHYKLEELHNIYGSDHSRSGTPSEDTNDNSQSNDDETEIN